MTVTAMPDARSEMATYFESNPSSAEAPSPTPPSPPPPASDTPPSGAPPASTSPDTPPSTDTSATAAASTPPPATPSFWDEPADDEDLHPSLKGKSRKEVWNSLKGALTREHQAGYQKNKAEAELEVQTRLNRYLEGELNRTRAPQAAQPPPPPAHAQLGILDPNQILTAESLNNIPDYVDQRIAAALQGVQQQNAATAQESLALRSEMAQSEAITAIGIDKNSFLEIRPFLANIMAVNNADPRIAQNWIVAAQLYRQSAARFFPSSQPITPTPPLAGNARPGVTPAPVAKKAASTGNKHVDRALQEHLEVWNKGRAVPYTLAQFQDMLYSDQAAGLTGEDV